LYLWIDGSTNRKFTVQPNGGDYWVIVTDMCYGFSDTINIDYLQIPDLHIGNDTVLCYGDPLVLDAYTRAYTYYWENDGSTNETFFPTESGAYTCTISGYCGSTSSTVNVEFKDCNIIVPNVYTPNGDGVNDYFEIDFAEGFEFEIFTFSVHIYDRWGKLMYHSLDPDFKWDGNESGSKASDGVYYWVITFSTQGGIYRELNGSVTRISSK
ncbi:MAG: gliding motility-associated C-terminal domain-containing protein, partial [Bacteroidales bacterium]|nr:gliding motility-associated C-terminal domain-containing protein [Bacteroidales bacterium]